MPVVLSGIPELCYGLGLPCVPAVIVRSDDNMPGEGFYELYRVPFYPWLHERPAARMRVVRREQRSVRRVGPDDRKLLLEVAALADRLTK